MGYDIDFNVSLSEIYAEYINCRVIVNYNGDRWLSTLKGVDTFKKECYVISRDKETDIKIPVKNTTLLLNNFSDLDIYYLSEDFEYKVIKLETSQVREVTDNFILNLNRMPKSAKVLTKYLFLDIYNLIPRKIALDAKKINEYK
jgi:hypothetical protein